MKISVIGLGKLGSPLAAVLASKGHQVIGVDINREFVEKINCGKASVAEPQLQELISRNRNRLRATPSYEEAVLNSNVTFLIVPTPSDQDGLFSNRYLLEAINEVGKALSKKDDYHLVVITSTVTPGSTQKEIKEALESSSGKAVGFDVGLCYNPEFIALGSVVRDMLFPDMILIGESDKKAGDLLESIYLTVCEKAPPVRRMNFINAEIVKIAINTYITMKISYANMLSDICERLLDADANVVTDAVGLDSRIGSKYLKGAVAFGGPCFPRDSIALAALAQTLGARADLAIATQSINEYQNERLFEIVKKHASSKKIGILGLSYKPGTYVVEESQGIKIANQLAEEGFDVSVFDPMALDEAKKILESKIHISDSLFECIGFADMIVLMIPWPEFKNITPALCKDKVIIDFWRILHQKDFEETSTFIYPGAYREELCAKR